MQIQEIMFVCLPSLTKLSTLLAYLASDRTFYYAERVVPFPKLLAFIESRDHALIEYDRLFRHAQINLLD